MDDLIERLRTRAESCNSADEELLIEAADQLVRMKEVIDRMDKIIIRHCAKILESVSVAANVIGDEEKYS